MNNRGAYKKKERNLRNMKTRYTLLDEGLKSPETIRKAIAKTLGGQRAFCSLALPNTDIEPISLNTFKTLARELYSSEAEANGDGFAYMDAMRSRLNRLVEVIPSGRSVKAKAERSEQESKAIGARLDAVESQNVLRSKAYLDIVSKIEKIVKDGEIEAQTKLRLSKLLSDHHTIYGHLFNPNVPTVSDGGAVLVHLPLRGAP